MPINALDPVAHLLLGLYMLWSNIRVRADIWRSSFCADDPRTWQKDQKHGKVVSYEDQLKGEGLALALCRRGCISLTLSNAFETEAGMHDLTELENPYHR